MSNVKSVFLEVLLMEDKAHWDFNMQATYQTVLTPDNESELQKKLKDAGFTINRYETGFSATRHNFTVRFFNTNAIDIKP